MYETKDQKKAKSRRGKNTGLLLHALALGAGIRPEKPFTFCWRSDQKGTIKRRASTTMALLPYMTNKRIVVDYSWAGLTYYSLCVIIVGLYQPTTRSQRF